MKSKSSVVVLLLASLACFGQVNSACFDLTKQYFECYLLNMTLIDDGWRQYYAPDPNIEGNFLDDYGYDYFLGDFTLEDGLELMRWINQEIANCDTETCQCIKQRKTQFWNNDDVYSVFFETDQNFDDVKSIISSVDNALENDRIPAEELQNYWGFGSSEVNLTSLTEFCSKAEYTMIRASVYRDYYSCSNYDDKIWHTCEYYKQVDSDKREAIIESSSERYLVCQILSSTDCTYEKQMFNALSQWVELYDRPDLSGESLIAYLEGLIAAAGNIDLEDYYSQYYIWLYTDRVYYKTLNTGWGEASLDLIGTSVPLLVSNSLSIEAQIEANEDETVKISQLNVVVNDEINGETRMELNLIDSELQNLTITSNDGINLVQIVSYQIQDFNSVFIYDFNSESIIYYYKDYAAVLGPKSLFDQSNGFLINGPPQSDDESTSNEGENKMSCKQMCENISKALKAIALPKHVAAPDDLKKCIQSC